MDLATSMEDTLLEVPAAAQEPLEPCRGEEPAHDLDASALQLLDAPSGKEVYCLAPYTLLRFATLPFSALEALNPRQTSLAVLRQLAAEKAMAREAPALTDALYAQVCRIPADDKHFRRKVLQLKREIHNGEPTKLDPVLLMRVREDLSGQPGELHLALARWVDAQAEFKVSQSSAQSLLDTELAEQLRPNMRAVLSAPLFHHALALAAPGIVAHSHRETSLPTKGAPDNFERSLLGYLTRAAAKTSPFSSFMSTTALQLRPPSPYEASDELVMHDVKHECRTRLNRGVIARIARGAVPIFDEGGPLLHVNPTFASIGKQRFRAVCNRDLIVLGRPWRQQSRSNFQFQDSLSQVLLGHVDRAPAGVWQERFMATGIDSKRAREVVSQLLDRNVLQSQEFTDAFDPEPEKALLRRLEGLSSPIAAETRANVQAMIEICDSMGGGDRVNGAERIRQLEETMLTRIGAPKAEALQNVVLEDCWSSASVDNVHVEQMAAAGDLSRFLSTQVGMSPLYLRLRDRFVARFGAAGSCADVLGFLIDDGMDLIGPREYGDTRAEDKVIAAPIGAALPVTVQAQAIAGAQPGSPQLVVNKVFENAAWLAARFSFGNTPEHERLREGIRQWLRTVAGDREPVDVVFNGDCNDLQAHPQLTKRVLSWPGEPLLVDPANSVDLRSLRLLHNPANGLLELIDREDRGIHLCQLGGTLPSPSWGMPFALSILTQPYQLMRPDFQPSTQEHAADIEFVPRMHAGRVVVRRAAWWVRTSYLMRAWFGEGGAKRLASVRRECARTGLPTVFFARRPPQAQSGAISNTALDANRKPLWVDIDNPFCLSVLERLCDGLEWMSFTEMLPGSQQLWLDVDGARHVSELQFELLLRRSVA